MAEGVRYPTTVTCGPCTTRHIKTNALHWCTSCEEGLCANCYDYHRASKASRHHSPITLEKYEIIKPLLSSIKTECEIHGSTLDLYCPNHDVPCCSICAATSHSSCLGITSFNKCVSNLKSSSYLEHLQINVDSFLNHIENIIKNRLSNKTKIMRQADDLVFKAAEFREHINTQLDILQKQLIVKGKSLSMEKQLDFDKLIQSLKDKKQNVVELRNNLSHLKESGSDIQSFLLSKQIEENVSKEKESLSLFCEGSALMEASIELKMDPNYSEQLSYLFNVCLNTEEPAFFSENCDKSFCQFPPEDVTKVTAVLKTRYDTSVFDVTTHITCVTMMTSGEIVISDRPARRLVTFNCDGRFNRTVSFIEEPFGLACCDQNKIAVSFPDINVIKIFETPDYSCESEICLHGPCWGLVFVDDIFVVAIRGHEILFLDSSGNTLKRYNMMQQNLVYIHKFDDRHFRTELMENSVHCYSSRGNKLWQFMDQEALGPRNMGTDAKGNLFVSCQDSNRIILISRDGKQHRVVLEVNEPQAIYFDATESVLYVCSLHGDVVSSYTLKYT